MNNLLIPKTNLHSKIRDINFEYDKLVVGSTVEALVYSFLNNIPFVCSRLERPSRFDFFKPEQDLDIFDLKAETRVLNSPSSQKIVGIKKNILWEDLFFHLSLAGLAPMGDKAISLRIEKNVLKGITKNARMAKFYFNELIIFSDYNLLGISSSQKKIKNELYEVHDWLDIRTGMKHDYDLIETTSDFVKCIFFYPSDRIEGEHNFKDAVAVSHLSEKQLFEYEYSDINARFKTKYLMKQAGIRGARNGRNMLDKTKYKYYAIKIENDRREVYPPKIYWKSTENIKFNYDPIDVIIKNNQLKDSYVRKISKRNSR